MIAVGVLQHAAVADDGIEGGARHQAEVSYFEFVNSLQPPAKPGSRNPVNRQAELDAGYVDEGHQGLRTQHIEGEPAWPAANVGHPHPRYRCVAAVAAAPLSEHPYTREFSGRNLKSTPPGGPGTRRRNRGDASVRTWETSRSEASGDSPRLPPMVRPGRVRPGPGSERRVPGPAWHRL